VILTAIKTKKARLISPQIDPQPAAAFSFSIQIMALGQSTIKKVKELILAEAQGVRNIARILADLVVP
jgi:hypothetical protein